MTPAMPLDIADYRADTAHLSAAEHGAYLLLIMHYWTTGGLPDDDVKLARVTAMTQEEWTRTRPTIEALFQPGWRHKRIDRELSEARENAAVSERMAALGRRSAEVRAVGNGRGQKECLPLATDANTTSSFLREVKQEREGRKQRGTRLEPTWTPTTSDLEAAKNEGLTDSDTRREAAKFRDYWIAKPGQAGIKLDWSATWRNWCRKAAEFLGRSPLTVPAEAGNQFHAKMESPQYEAWKAHMRKTKPGWAATDKTGGWTFPTEWPPGHEYKPHDDFSKSIDVCYDAVRERVAAGGPNWTPK